MIVLLSAVKSQVELLSISTSIIVCTTQETVNLIHGMPNADARRVCCSGLDSARQRRVSTSKSALLKLNLRRRQNTRHVLL